MVDWADVARRAERWLLPPQCVVCLQPVVDGSDRLVCAVCSSRWRAIELPRCSTCGEPQPLRLECRVCAEWPPDFGPVQSAVRLAPDVRRLVHRFKYQGWRRLADDFAPRVAALLPEWDDDVDLVPIPLSRRRRRDRGYNQAGELAAAVGRIVGVPVCPERLWRVRDTPTQTKLTPEGRLANLAHAFAARASVRRVVLVDDVFTTGATLCSAAGALLDQGAGQVGAVTFARAELPLAGLMPTERTSLLSESRFTP